MRLAVWILATAALGSTFALGPAVAHANEALDAAVASLSEGEFEAALRSFAEAEAGALSRPELSQLYAQRALAHHALRDDAAMRTDLTRLASLDPGRELPRSAPPPVVEAFSAATERAMGGLALEVRQRRRGGSVQLTVRVAHDLGAIVNEVTLSARPEGSAEWTTGDPSSLVLVATDGDVIEIRARAIGPGGAVLVERGTRPSAERLLIGDAPPAELREAAVEESLRDGGNDDVAIGVGVGITLALLLGAGAAVLAYVLLSQGPERNEIAPPTTGIWSMPME